MEDCLKPPEWVVALENKKKHKLAHDVGAGAPCLNCLDACLGLDLHFWRKLCRNCKCKKEAHDIKDEDNYQQFEILFGENALKNKEGMRKFAEDLASKLENGPYMKKLMESLAQNEKNKSIKFDWLPLNVPVNIASEYLQEIPVEKVPISGSEGAIFRRQQLEKQMPLHDFDVNNCHDLSTEETQAFTDYVENVKNSVVGQGYIAKIPSAIQYRDGLKEIDGALISCGIVQPTVDNKSSSYPKNLNITPKPFKPFVESKNDITRQSSSASPLLPDLLQPVSGLKTPSAFIKNANNNNHNHKGVCFETGNEANSNVFGDTAVASEGDYSNNRSSSLTTGSEIGFGAPPDLYGNMCKENVPWRHGDKDSATRPYGSKLKGMANCAEDNGSNVYGLETYKENSMRNGPTKVEENASGMDVAPFCKQNVLAPVRANERLHAVTAPAQFNASSFGLRTNKPTSVGDVISYYGTNDDAIGQLTTANRKPKVRFGNATFIEEEEDVGQLADQLGSLPPISSENNQTPPRCHHCKEALLPGQVAVLAEKAELEFMWHPKCFVCNTCKELLVDLVYFFHKENVYCGRHYAEAINIPRCYACDELIFLKEYTVAEGQSFHVKHFCCFECDSPLAGMQYVPKDDHPVCLPCYNAKYGKKCNSCRNVIGASDARLGFKELNWHATPVCFKCFQCSKSLLGGQFAVRDNQPFCSKECVQKYKNGQ